MIRAAAALPSAAMAPREASLGDLAREKGVLLGSMATLDLLEDSPALLPRALARDARIILPGLEMKWRALRPGPDRFDFGPAEAMLAFAEGIGLPSKGHTLVWHVDLPAWFPAGARRDEMRAVMERHVTTVCRRLSPRLHSWDVVNEPIQVHEGNAGGMRGTPFFRALGPDYVEMAFEMAAAADPRPLRVLNEFNVEMDDADYQAPRRAALLALLERLVRRRAPVDALGIQGHLSAGRWRFSPEVFAKFLRDVASLGLRIQITELDVTDRRLPGAIPERDRQVAALLRDVLTVALAEPAVDFVTLWGLSDRATDTDRHAESRRTDGLPSRPHPLDADFARKPAWDAISAALRAAPARPWKPGR